MPQLSIMRYLQVLSQNRYTAHSSANSFEIASELSLLKKDQQFILPTHLNPKNLSLIFQNMPAGSTLIISDIKKYSLESLKSAIQSLAPDCYLSLSGQISQEKTLKLIAFLPAGTKWVLAENASLDFQIKCLQKLPPLTYVTTSAFISPSRLKILIKNLGIHCIFEMPTHWGPKDIDKYIEILPPFTGFYTPDWSMIEYLAQKLKPHHLFPIPSISAQTKIEYIKNNFTRISILPRRIEFKLKNLLSRLPAGCVVCLPNTNNQFLMSRLTRILQSGNILLVHDLVLMEQIDKLSAMTGVQFSPNLDQNEILKKIPKLKRYQTYAAHPQENFSLLQKISKILPQNTGMIFPVNMNEKQFIKICSRVKAFNWIVTPYHFSQDIIVNGIKRLSHFCQVMIHPYLSEAKQVHISQRMPDWVIYTPHPQTSHLQLVKNVQNLKSLAIFMPYFEQSNQHVYIYDALKELSSQALFMQDIDQEPAQTISTLRQLKCSSYFIPHPDTSADVLIDICRTTPRHIRYIPNYYIQIAANQVSLSQFNPGSSISIHPHTPKAWTQKILEYVQHPEQLLFHPKTPEILWGLIYQKIFEQKKVLLASNHFFQRKENLETALDTIKTLPPFSIYTPAADLPMQIIAKCLPNLPPQTIFRPHSDTSILKIIQCLAILPKETIFSPDAGFSGISLIQCLEYFPNHCLLIADILTPQYIIKLMKQIEHFSPSIAVCEEKNVSKILSLANNL
jgi:hypothetical protein